MSSPYLPGRLLFRFAVACRRFDALPTLAPGGLGPEYKLPALGELEGQAAVADLRAAWSPLGIGFTLDVVGKKQEPWCRDSRPDESDGLQLWIDTRDTKNIHRAGRFCHRLVFLPLGTGVQSREPLADQLLVDRARENAQPMRPGQLRAACQLQRGGYRLAGYIPGAALTGFNPADHPRLGFAYRFWDRELGEQTFSIGGELPFPSDPSLWGTLELAE